MACRARRLVISAHTWSLKWLEMGTRLGAIALTVEDMLMNMAILVVAVSIHTVTTIQSMKRVWHLVATKQDGQLRMSIQKRNAHAKPHAQSAVQMCILSGTMAEVYGLIS